jgi:hypothetical protein
LKAFSAQLAAFYGVDPSAKVIDGQQVQAWSLQTPSPIEVETSDGKKKLSTELYLREANASIDEEVKRGTGIYEVVLWTSQNIGTESILAQSQGGRLKLRPISTA